MNIIYYNDGEDNAYWLAGLRAALPHADIRLWLPGNDKPADYALVWKPPAGMLAGRTDLKAIFNLAAGVDALLGLGNALPANVPILRLEDAGMGMQMAEYATHAVLHHYRRFDEYARQAQKQEWRYLETPLKRDFTVGIMGLGTLGRQVAQALLHFGFPVRGWSRSRQSVSGVRCYAGRSQLDEFLEETKALICLLPATAETAGILSRDTLGQLAFGAYLINLARGSHLVEADLLDALDSGRIAGATLDVAAQEPLPPGHPFWHHPRVTITPHIAAATLRDDTVRQVTEKLLAFDRGEAVTGMVDRHNGY
ncbi:MAG: glyoxylate/hydroxypyruvate reductase [Proteobacteria bacterium]|nr:glyoxylate/hydroxypyruvate reductase [Pseudomonadota bacterium]